MRNEIDFNELNSSDLKIDALYKGGNFGNSRDDPISKLMGCGNQGGFRYRGRVKDMDLKFVVLYSSLADPDWPDYLDNQTGRLIYFGDNKLPGSLLHETRKNGNLILKQCFDLLHIGERKKIPPFFIFPKQALEEMWFLGD